MEHFAKFGKLKKTIRNNEFRTEQLILYISGENIDVHQINKIVKQEMQLMRNFTQQQK